MRMSNAQLAINPQILTWARTRVHRDLESLKKRFPKLAEWEKGRVQPTLSQLEAFARAVYLPIGYLFLPQPIEEAIQRLSKIFKVSTLVSLRRLFDAGYIHQDELWKLYQSELNRIKQLEKNNGGGDFYRTLGARTGKRFARAVVSSTLEGQTLFQEAFRMLGIKKTKTFYEMLRRERARLVLGAV